MAKDVQDTVREVLTKALDGSGHKSNNGSGGLSGLKGVAAGAGAAALVPLAVKNAGKLTRAVGEGLPSVPHSPQEALHGVGSKIGDRVGDKVSEKVDEAGGPKGILKGTLKDALPFGGDSDDEDEGEGGGKGKGGVPGVGKGRRMPVQQSVDIGVPIQEVYNQFTQFEDWPEFMHRVKSVSQEDPTTVSFTTKIWGISRQYSAEIETQRPDQRIKWKVTQGMTHTGVVTFHELAPNLTRVLLGMDVEPGGMLEKFARGARNIKRAARADLHRFKAYIEMQEEASGGWRGVIEDGEVVEEPEQQEQQQRRRSRSASSSRSGGSQQRSRTSSRSSGSSRSRQSASRSSSSGGSGGRSRSRNGHDG